MILEPVHCSAPGIDGKLEHRFQPEPRGPRGSKMLLRQIVQIMALVALGV